MFEASVRPNKEPIVPCSAGLGIGTNEQELLQVSLRRRKNTGQLHGKGVEAQGWHMGSFLCDQVFAMIRSNYTAEGWRRGGGGG